MSGLPPEVARTLHEPVVGLQKAAAALASRLDRLCDPGLLGDAREEDTEQLYSELEDAELALEAFGDVVLGGERTGAWRAGRRGEGGADALAPARMGPDVGPAGG